MKLFNKLISFILVFVIAVSLFSFSSSAAETFSYRLLNFSFYDGLKPDDISLRTDQGKTVTRVGFSSSSSAIRLSGYYKVTNEFKIGSSYTLNFSISKGPSTGLSGLTLYLAPSLPFDDKTSFMLADVSSDELSSTSYKDYSIQLTLPDSFNGKQVYLFALLTADNKSSSLWVTDFVFTNNNDTDEKIDGILEWLSAVYHSIVGGEDSRGVKHDGLVQGIKNGLSGLGDRISGFFDNLGEKISNTFIEFGEKVKDGFDYIVDMILYFEHPVEKNSEGIPINIDTGQPVYTNPFESVWKQIEQKLDEWITKISDFIDSMNSARDNVVAYMDTGKQLIDGALKKMPIVSAILLFVAGFYVIRKVVGQ